MGTHQKAPTSHPRQRAAMAAGINAFPWLAKDEAELWLGLTEVKRRKVIKTAVLTAIGKNSSVVIKEPDPKRELWLKFYETHFPTEVAAAGGADALRALTIPASENPELTELFVGLKGVEGLTETRIYYHRGAQEADETHKGKSANDVAREGIKCMSLSEYEIFGKFYLEQTGNRLDLSNWTLFPKSRDSIGNVLKGYWYKGVFRWDWVNPGGGSGSLRVREVSC